MRDIRTAAVLVAAMAATLPSARALATADIQPIHSFEDIPPLAKDTAEVRRRFGDVTVMPGKTIKGDTSARPLFQRMADWTQSLMQQAMQPMLKAGDAYLAGLAGPYTTFKARMKSVAAQAQSTIDQADKSFAGSVPAFVRPMYQSVITVGVAVLGMVVSAESDAVAHVHERSIASTESR